MNYFSATSKARLNSCHIDIRRLFNAVLQITDCSILEGYRSEDRQNELFKGEKSKVVWPFSKHNKEPSEGVDVGPYFKGLPKLTYDKVKCHEFAKIVLETAKTLNIKIRWGGDWDGDGDTMDQTFNDLVHYELITDD